MIKKGDRVAESTSVKPLVKISIGKGGLNNLKLQKGTSESVNLVPKSTSSLSQIDIS